MERPVSKTWGESRSDSDETSRDIYEASVSSTGGYLPAIASEKR
jgi:hypothetical protein